MCKAEAANLVFARRAFSEVLLDLAFFLRSEGANHVGSEEVPEFQVRAHQRVTLSRLRSCSRAERAARLLSDS